MAEKDNKEDLKRNKLRVHKHLFSLNDAENRALMKYMKKYRISNKSRFIRETLMYAILKKLEEDSPTLFD